MSKRSAHGYRHILFLSSVVIVTSIAYFLYTVNTKWQDLKEISQSKRSSAIRSHAHLNLGHALEDQKETETNIHNVLDANSDEEGFVQIQTSTNTDKSINVTNLKNMTKHVECPEGKVYLSNDLYDCDGIMKNKDKAKTKQTDAKNKSTDEEEQESLVVPTRIKQMNPKLSSEVRKDSEQMKEKKNIDEIEKKGNNVSRKIFVNCGGTFPWAVELFLDTYPYSSLYEIFTFLPDISYKVMYSKFQNHTVISREASYKNGTKNVNVKSFGAGSEVTQSTFQIDLAEWLKMNTKKSDFVILRIDSEDEIKILKYLDKSKALEHTDKYYTTRGFDASKQEMDAMHKILKQFKLKVEIWDKKYQTYSDFFLLNRNHIPAPGKHFTVCQQTGDEERFALFLISPSASVNALKVINLLHDFSPKDRLQLTIFLPYQVFKSGLIQMEKLFATFRVGMYFDEDRKFADDKFQYTLLTNKLTFVRKLFSKYGHVFQYVLAGNNTSNKVIVSVQENHHYSFVKGGSDITHLTKKILDGKTVSIDDTGKGNGDFLLVNIDTPDSEYLVLYMVRRFAPWLLNLSECDVINTGELLNKTDSAVL